MTLDLEDAKTLLRRTPSVLDSLLRDLPETWVHENEGPDTWSSFDVVGHLIEAEETNWIPRARHLLEHGESAAFPPFDRLGFEEKSKGKSMAEVLDAFASARTRSLSTWWHKYEDVYEIAIRDEFWHTEWLGRHTGRCHERARIASN